MARPMVHPHCLFSSTPLTSVLRRAARTLVHTSVYSSVPRKTTAVPIQCQTVKGFWKYHTETMRLRNFLRVTTRVTVSDAHSVVRMNTPRMHTYLRAVSGNTLRELQNYNIEGLFESYCFDLIFFISNDELPGKRGGGEIK